MVSLWQLKLTRLCLNLHNVKEGTIRQGFDIAF